MAKIVSLKPEKNPDAEEAYKAILDFAESCKEANVTSICLVGISPTQESRVTFYIGTGEHLRLLGLMHLTRAQFELDMMEDLAE